jgi:ribulose 1,5-bisphosphate synthetase/thiazole synthase
MRDIVGRTQAALLRGVVLCLAIIAPLIAQPVKALPQKSSSGTDPDLIIVGAGLAGLAGLSAALEASRSGAKILVIDEASIFGGHPVMSAGDVSIVDTPLQRSHNIHDSAELAYHDFM